MGNFDVDTTPRQATLVYANSGVRATIARWRHRQHNWMPRIGFVFPPGRQDRDQPRLASCALHGEHGRRREYLIGNASAPGRHLAGSNTVPAVRPRASLRAQPSWRARTGLQFSSYERKLPRRRAPVNFNLQREFGQDC
jgi:hypothetical protein